MKIKFVCEGFNASTAIALPWSHIYEIAKKMRAFGNTVEISTDYTDCMTQNEKLGNLEIRRIKKGLLFFNSEDLLKDLNESQADIINWFGGPLSAIYFWRYRGLIKKKIVWTIYRGKVSFNDIKGLKLMDLPLLYKFWSNFSYSLIPNHFVKMGTNIPQIKMITVWSKRLRSYLQEIGTKEDKISVIPPGVDVQKFRPTASDDDSKESIGLNKRDLVILYFGPLSPFRGIDILASAMSKILNKFPSAKLLILARESSNDIKKKSLIKEARLQKATWLITGIQNQKTVAQYLASADVVALPFRFWPYIEVPLTILEAMAMEKPVVTTCITSIPEIVSNGETGLLVPPKKTEALANAVIKLLADKDLSIRIGKKARAHVNKFYSWDRVVEQTLHTFHNSLID